MSSRLTLSLLRLLHPHLHRDLVIPAYPKSVSRMAEENLLKHRNQGKQQRDSQEHGQEWESKPPYRLESPTDLKQRFRQGKCHCGQVSYELTRKRPLDVKFCHCRGCQVLHGEFDFSVSFASFKLA